MRLHVLGRGGGCPGPGGGCAGYLVEAAEGWLMLDCGPGTLGRLQGLCGLEELDAVVLSHLHADHCLDLVPLAYGLMMRCRTRDPDRRLKRVPLFVPPDGRAALAALSGALGHRTWRFAAVPEAAPVYGAFLELVNGPAADPDWLFALLPTTEYGFGDRLNEAGLGIRFVAVEHGPPTAAIRLDGPDGSLAYSGDTAPCPGLVEIARGADLLLCEATTAADAPGPYPGHLSPTDAGRVAREARVVQLVLTHLSPWGDEGWTLAQAEREFAGMIRLAREGDAIEVRPADDRR